MECIRKGIRGDHNKIQFNLVSLLTGECFQRGAEERLYGDSCWPMEQRT